MTDLPRDKNGNLYENRKYTGMKVQLKKKIKNGAKEAVRKQSRDSTDKPTKK